MMIRFKTMSFQTFILLAVMLCCLPASAIKNGSEGEEWIKWTPEARVIYIRAYVAGFYKGHVNGCDTGISAVPPVRKSHDIDSKARTKCLGAFPFLDGDPIRFVPLITDFYTNYPGQRHFDISDVLLQASKGHSVKEIHEHFLQSNIP
jgi:hypothetical protein